MPLKIGIAGLGEVAQLMHLPILQDLKEHFEVTAAADISPTLTAYIGDKYHIPQRYTSTQEMIEQAGTDAVLVLTPDPYHAEAITLALEQGKHIFVEKPVTLSSKELENLVEIEKRHPGQVVMVGYMRRYAAPYQQMKLLLQDSRFQTEHLRFRDIICEGPFYIGQTRPVFYPQDVPEAALREGSEKRRAYMDSALGAAATPGQRTTHMMFTGLGSHSFSAVRELFGPPQKVLSAHTAAGGQQVVVVLQYDGFLGVYELVNNQSVVQFDASIEVFQNTRKLCAKYETPYIRNQPMYLEVDELVEGEARTLRYGPDYRDPFRTELLEFHSHIQHGTRPKTTMEDSLADLRLFEEIIRVLQKEEA